MRARPHSDARAHRARPGFTLLELMIALTVGGIAITAIYSVSSASTRHFREQQRVSSTQSALRVALDQLKRDFQRAGYLGTPNGGLPGEFCTVAPTAPLHSAITGLVAAVSRFRDDVAMNEADVDPGGVIDPGGVNGMTADQVVLMGNYSTAGEYAQISLSDPATLTIPPNWQSFRRDFTNWTNGTYDGSRVTEAFRIGRMVRLHALNETHHFAQVQSVVTGATSPTLTFAPGVPGGCTPGSGWVSPLNAIRYHVQAAPAAEASIGGATGGNGQLRRTEVMPTDKVTPLAANGETVDDRVVLDYVVGFNLRFLLTNGNPDTVTLDVAPVADVNSFPERIRGVIIDLAARTPEYEPAFPCVVGADPLRPRCFKVFSDANLRGGARVRTARAELFLPNIALEGY